VGQFDKVGVLYYSDKATANILSFASQIDEGAAIDYDKFTNAFRPANDERINTFARLQTLASICDANDRIFAVALSE
jgi:hypothetical protein